MSKQNQQRSGSVSVYVSIDWTQAMKKLFPLIVTMLLMSTHALAENRTVVTIGVLTDGPMEGLGEVRSLFFDELRNLTEGEFMISFPESKQFDGQWSTDRITAAVMRLQNDPEVDMVLALGLLSSQLAATSSNLRKPTFAPFVFNPDLLGISRNGNVSGVKNLNYLTTESQFDAELKTFLNVIEFTHLALLADESQYRFFPEAVERTIKTARSQGIVLHFITNSTADEALAAKIPAVVQAVMIAPLPRLNRTAKQKLIAGLIEQHLPSYTLADGITVEQGIFMSAKATADLSRKARRTALNMEAVLHGAPASRQPVIFEEKRQLTINMKTARAIGVSPDFELLHKAVLLYHEPEVTSQPMSLAATAQEAIKANLTIVAGQLGVQAGSKNIAEARSVLFPRIFGNVSYLQNNDDNVFVQSGFYAEKSTAGSIKLEQILFSESTLANLAIQKHLQVAREAQQRTLELEIVQQATTTFLNVLIAQTHLRIQQNNLKLTQTNLELARNRVQVGAADVSDVYRWESEMATIRQNVLQANANLEKARDGLNRILHRSLSDRFITEPATLDDPSLLISRKALLNSIANERAYDLMGKFFITEAFGLSPELAQLEAQIAAQARQLESDQRAYWSPDITLIGEVSRTFDETRDQAAGFSLEDQTNWQAGINLSLPLFEGGARRARSSRSELNVQQLKVRYQGTREAVEQRIRGDLHAIRASYPSIELSAQAADAACKSFELVRENYSEGTRSMTDLLVAQNASLAADQSAANAVYKFLLDLMSLQRDIGEFDFFLDDPRRDLVSERLEAFIAGGDESLKQR